MEAGGVRRLLVRGGLGVLAVRLVGGGVAFGVQILLARMAGPEAYGIYTYALAWAMILTLVSRVGVDSALMRFLAAYRAQEAWDLAHGVLRGAVRFVTVSSIVVAVLMAVTALALAERLEPGLALTLAIAALMVPLLGNARVRRAAMQSLQRPVKAVLPEELLRELFLAAALGLAWLFGLTRIGAPWAAAATVFAAVLALIIGVHWLRRAVPEPLRRATPVYRWREWLVTSAPLAFLSGMVLLNNYLDIVMVGALLGTEEAGIYAVAARGTIVLELGLIAANAVVAPMISAMHSTGRHGELQRMITLSARGVFLFVVPVALVLGVWGREILGLFGPAFVVAYGVLLIMIGGQLVNCLAGSTGFLMTMTGHQKEAAWVVGISVALNVALNLLLIPAMGMAGAAVATAVALAFWNLVLVFRVHRLLGIHSTVFGAWWSARAAR